MFRQVIGWIMMSIAIFADAIGFPMLVVSHTSSSQEAYSLMIVICATILGVTGYGIARRGG